MRIIDANILLRYLLADNESMTEQASNIIDNSQINLPIEVLCEVVYVLEKIYKVVRNDISDQLITFIDDSDTIIPHNDAVLSGLKYYAETKLDFVDCILVGYAEKENAEIHTFDKDLNKLLSKVHT